MPPQVWCYRRQISQICNRLGNKPQSHAENIWHRTLANLNQWVTSSPSFLPVIQEAKQRYQEALANVIQAQKAAQTAATAHRMVNLLR